MVSSKCNISCRHCYLSFDGERTPEDTLRLTKMLKKRNYEVLIAGREILLNLGYLKSYEAAEQKYILTNGLLIQKNPNIAGLIADYGLKEVQISIHFGIEGYLKSAPAEIAKEAIKICRNRGLETCVLTTINNKNFRKALEMCDESYELGADKIMFMRHISLGAAEINCANDDLKESDKAEFFDLIDLSKAKYRLSELEIRMSGNFGPKKGSEGEILAAENRYCPAIQDLFVITPDNRVYGCPFLLKYPLGELRGDKIVINGDLFGGRRDVCLAEEMKRSGT